jgi:hypothetical protein
MKYTDALRRLEHITFGFLSIALGSCAQPSRAPSVGTGYPTPWCITQGRSVDSAYAFDQARVALAPSPPLVLVARSVDHVPEGMLLRMVVSEPRGTRGGGGLVWVNVETGCAIVLIRYE